MSVSIPSQSEPTTPQPKAAAPATDSPHPTPITSPGDGLRKYVPQIMLDNGPRVVAGLKIAGCVGMVTSKNWAFRTAGWMFITGNAIMAAFGHKKPMKNAPNFRQKKKPETAAKSPTASSATCKKSCSRKNIPSNPA